MYPVNNQWIYSRMHIVKEVKSKVAQEHEFFFSFDSILKGADLSSILWVSVLWKFGKKYHTGTPQTSLFEQHWKAVFRVFRDLSREVEGLGLG